MNCGSFQVKFLHMQVKFPGTMWISLNIPKLHVYPLQLSTQVFPRLSNLPRKLLDRYVTLIISFYNIRSSYSVVAKTSELSKPEVLCLNLYLVHFIQTSTSLSDLFSTLLLFQLSAEVPAAPTIFIVGFL